MNLQLVIAEKIIRIHEIEITLEALKESLLKNIEDIDINNEKETSDIISLIYWSETIPFSSLYPALNLSKNDLFKIIKPLKLEKKCPCGSNIYANSHSHKNQQEKIGLCDMCQSEKREIERRRTHESFMQSDKDAEIRASRLLELKNMPYRDYLVTEEWKETREWQLRFAKYKRQICNSNKKLNVHHRTYERIGCEYHRVLVVLCENCHKLYHFQLGG